MKLEIIVGNTQMLTDGKTIWVNDNTGCCIGRFSARGVDVHNTGANQMKLDKQCLDCFHEGSPTALWERFRSSMLTHHGVEIPEEFRPKFTL